MTVISRERGFKLDLRDSIFGEVVTKFTHERVNARPIMADFFILSITKNDGEAEIALGGDIPLLITSRHLENVD